MQTIILENLSKTYPGGRQAVRQVSLSLGPGEVYGFLGPNGAGKTTTVKLLNGMLTPSGGSCRVYGIDPSAEPAKAHAHSGVVTEHAQMYDNLTGMENLLFFASVFGLSPSDSRNRARTLLRQLALEDASDKKLSAYSTGMRQRLSLARALIHRPEVLFLDEPTSGLDPESAQNVNQMIRNLAEKEGTTVFLCTHQLRYAQEVCTRYGLIEEGRLLASGTLTELQRDILPELPLFVRVQHMPHGLPFQKTDEENLYQTSIHSEGEIPSLVRQLIEGGGDVYSVEVKHPSLEEIYFTLTRDRRRTENTEDTPGIQQQDRESGKEKII